MYVWSVFVFFLCDLFLVLRFLCLCVVFFLLLATLLLIQQVNKQ